MLRACVAALACLCLARLSSAEVHSSRPHGHASHNNKDLNAVLATIEERLRLLEVINTAQTKQARRLDVIQDKLDRVETTLSLRLERAQLASERLEHRLHMLQVTVEKSIKDNTARIDRSQSKIVEITQNLTSHLDSHRHLLEKVSGAYAETWRRGLILESLMRDGLSLINVTRRELADGLRALARRQRDPRLLSIDMEAAFSRRLNDNTTRFYTKIQEVLDTQKRFMDSCQRVQLDDPTHVADMLDKLIDSLINKTASTFHELQSIQSSIRNHDNRVIKLLSTGRSNQNEATCKRLESTLRNVTHSTKESELQQMTEKFIALTDRADAALQRLESHLADEGPAPVSDVTSAADKLFLKLKGIKSEQESEEDDKWEDEEDEQDGYFDDFGPAGADIMAEDREILSGSRHIETTTARLPHRRHPHKHPYDRGPMRNLP